MPDQSKKPNSLTFLLNSLPQYGDHIAVMALSETRSKSCSYTELADNVEQMAQVLAAMDVMPGEAVALFASESIEYIIACLAIIRAGGMVMPVDIQSDDKSLQHVLLDSAARLILTNVDKVERLHSVTDIQLIIVDADKENQQGWRHLPKSSKLLPHHQDDDPAALFYTSGTTGRPKGVMLSHANLTFQIKAVAEAGVIGKGDRMAIPLPLHHVYPFVIGMLAPLALGLVLIIPYSLTGPQIVRSLKEGEATIMVGVPRLYEAMYTGIMAKVKNRGGMAARIVPILLSMNIWLQHLLNIQIGKRLFLTLHQQIAPKLRILACGGAPLEPMLARQLQGLGWELSTGYGLTETAPLLTMNLPGSKKLDSIGQVVKGVKLKIDTTAFPTHSKTASNPIKDSTPFPQGEILARGINVFKGYRGLPAQTAAAFTDDGWFRTGDLGYIDSQGYVYITGRIKELIITKGGENIQPGMVETIYTEHPLICEFALLTNDHGRLTALVVPEIGEIRHQGYDKFAPAIRTAIAAQSKLLPSYQRISHYVLSRDPLPRTRLGKLRRHLLPELYDRAQLLAKTKGNSNAGNAMPISEMSGEDIALLNNQTVRQVWQWLALRYKNHRLTPETSPQLDLGVDSLEWVTLTLEIEQNFGIQLSAEALARIDTIRDFLREISEAPTIDTEGASTSLLYPPAQAISETQKKWITPLNASMSFMATTLHLVNRLAMRIIFRLKVKGLENLPADGQVVITPNHVSYLDSFVVGAALPITRLRQTYWAGWTGIFFNNALVRIFSRLGRVVPIDPDRSVISSLALSSAILTGGNSLVWFPEGERSVDGTLKPFRPGIGFLLDRFALPVVPVYIHGAYKVLPIHRKWPRLRRITLVFGHTLTPTELAEQGVGKNSSERMVNALQQQVAELGKRDATID